jgi:hypothetical protein
MGTLTALVERRPLTFVVEVFAGAILWIFFGGLVPEDVPVLIWISIAGVGLAVGAFGKWRLSGAKKREENGGREPWYSVLWRYDMYGNRIPPFFLVVLTHVFTISGSFYAVVSISRLWQ